MTAAPTTVSSTTVLSLRGISKRFGAVQALNDVSVECLAGEVHAVVGENGSGKSTLLAVASGVLAPDQGTVEIGGVELQAAHAAEALGLGVGTAYQTYSHVLDLSVAENLFLATPRSERPRYRSMTGWARERLAAYGLTIPVEARMGTLQLADRQFLEVVKVLLSQPKVLLLDEPTTALGPGEVERLHELVLARAAEGVGVVYVSHRLPEVLGLADRVSVLRDGVHQGTFTASEMTEEHLVALMIGHELTLSFAAHDSARAAGVVVLSVRALTGNRVGPVDFDLHAGEILGVAGAAGNGQDEILRCLAGVERASGTVTCRGRDVDLRSPNSALRAGIMLLSGERARESLFPVLGVRSNATLQVLQRFSRLGWVHRGREHDAVVDMVDRLKVRTPSIEQPVRFLSGGNQQKVVLTRPFLRGDISVVIADEPTQGVDVASRFDIYDALRRKTDEGVGIIVKSSDPIELSGLCDRVLVVSRGRIVDEIAGDDLSERRIIEGIVGSRAPGAATEAGGSHG